MMMLTRGPAAPALSLVEPLESRRLMAANPTVVEEGAVRIETSMGRITFLLSDATPITTENFLEYVRAGRFNNTVFHRSVDNFVIQAGGFAADGNFADIGKPSDKPIQNEFAQAKAAAGGGKVNVRGTVAMAKLGNDPNSATSEFFISTNDNSSNLDNQNGGFTVFARVSGGSLHVADAINDLETMDFSFLNPAFTDLPVINTGSGANNAVVVSSARAQDLLNVTLNAGNTRSVTWVDPAGGTSTITLSSGKADLTFVGPDIKVSRQGNRITVTGKNVSLEEVTTRQTNKSSVLTVTGGTAARPTNVGNITVTGGHLGRINAPTARLLGDITAANHAISSINLAAADRSVITTRGGSLTVDIDDAVSTSVRVNGNGTLKSFRADRWTDNGQAATSFFARDIGTLDIGGSFSSNVTATRNIGTILVDGDVGHLGSSTWIAKRIESVRVRNVGGLQLAASKQLGDFRARNLGAAPDNSVPNFNVGRLVRLDVASLNSTTIRSQGNINAVIVSGDVDASLISSQANIDSVRIGGDLTGNFGPNGIYAGANRNAPAGTFAETFTYVPDPDKPLVTKTEKLFVGKGGVLRSLTVEGDFSNTAIAAPSVGPVDIRGTVRLNNNGREFGVMADHSIGRVTAKTPRGAAIDMPAVTTQAQIKSYFSNAGISEQSLGHFKIRIV